MALYKLPFISCIFLFGPKVLQPVAKYMLVVLESVDSLLLPLLSRTRSPPPPAHPLPTAQGRRSSALSSSRRLRPLSLTLPALRRPALFPPHSSRKAPPQPANPSPRLSARRPLLCLRFVSVGIPYESWWVC